MKKLVAYFSATGNTAIVANRLAEAIGADVFEIEPLIPYTEEDLNWKDSKSRSSLEMADLKSRPEIRWPREDIPEVQILYIGFPIWWYEAPRIINTFLESYDLTGKTIIPFATSGGSGMEKVNASIIESCKRAFLKEGRLFDKNVSPQELSNFQ